MNKIDSPPNPAQSTSTAANSPRSPQRPRAADDDFLLVTAPSRPLIKPRCYDAKSTAVVKNKMYDRHFLRIAFTIFEGDATDGVIIATGVDGFFPMGDDSRRPGPSSKIVRLMQLLDPNGPIAGVRASDLTNKLWRVRVETVDKDRKGNALHPANHYSKVADVLERVG
jgi:hypothetical protein